MYKKGNQVQFACYVSEEQMLKLKKLSGKTDVPVSVYIRRGVDMVLKKEKIK